MECKISTIHAGGIQRDINQASAPHRILLNPTLGGTVLADGINMHKIKAMLFEGHTMLHPVNLSISCHYMLQGF